MDVIIGTLGLLAVLALFSLFTFKAPFGSKAMSALADAAVASFLVEALLGAVLGDAIGIQFFSDIGTLAGTLSGIAAAVLVALAMKVNPGYAIMIALPLAEFGILPGFIAGYVVSFLVRWLQEKVPNGINLLGVIFIATPISYGIAFALAPVVNNLLLSIGDILISAQDQSPIVMGVILGGILVVVSTAPLSSMALTAIMGLTGQPMAIGALAVFGSGFLNYIFFRNMKLTSPRETISVGIEALTKAHVISANPIPVYSVNFVHGALSGVVIALSGLINNSPGTAAVVPGIASMFAWNDPILVLGVAAIVAAIGATTGYLGSKAWKNYPVRSEDDILSGTKPGHSQEDSEVAAENQ